MAIIEKFRRKSSEGETGATVVEYTVILALFVLLIIGVVALMERKVENSFDAVSNELANPPGS